MRLYTRTGATTLDHAEYGHFDASPDGGFDLPHELAEHLHGFHVAGRPMWETDIERQRRLIAEELERRKDPRTLLNVVEQMEQMMKAAQAATTEPAPKSPRARKTPAASE